MSIQAFFNAVSAGEQRQRARNGATLGWIINALSKVDPETPVKGLGPLDSYRGYYSDLAFTPIDGHRPRTAADVLDECRRALGATFEGYKGGDYVMDEDTPLWVSAWGERSGERLVGLEVHAMDGSLRPVTRQEGRSR